MWHRTRASALLGVEYPILQGPFGGGLSTVALVSTVSNLGGLGGYGAYTLSPEEIYAVDKQIRAATDKPYNLNLWVSDTDAADGTVSDAQYAQVAAQFRPYFDALGLDVPPKPAPFQSRFANQVQAVLDIRPPVFSFMFGIPSPDVLEACRRRQIKLMGAATTLDEALALENAGVDLIVASGFEAGGHRPSFLAPAEQSTTGTFVLLQLIREKTKLPVIAAGGIASGRGVAAALTLGADAVQIGTAFLACDESGALPVHKAALFSAEAKYTTLTRAYTGRLGRGLRTRITLDLLAHAASHLPFPLQTTFMAPLRKAALEQQKLDTVFFWGGQIAPLLRHRNAAALMQALLAETSALLA
ncbi:nitronate monooxygenase [Hymenobacter sp. 15J16-1T3B]|uniref:NAD(P)H-dependent flavin oxidoreductase n=1 Tax=Hymenobacter sp. 15J16-1T3B TaxID=2886941 RepID=UPI001D101304|nr:nitronate monooxygenase [Hymenobacter sp. 15J16-1T3B]MCC3158684.1 nitronate monooxygenase [Hymenobacter sp. 15J16-1T3B]